MLIKQTDSCYKIRLEPLIKKDDCTSGRGGAPVNGHVNKMDRAKDVEEELRWETGKDWKVSGAEAISSSLQSHASS